METSATPRSVLTILAGRDRAPTVGRMHGGAQRGSAMPRRSQVRHAHYVRRATPYTMRFDPAPELVSSARDCEQDVFLERYGNTPQEWNEEYGPYDEFSYFLTVADREGLVVACSRIILPNPVGLKTLNDAARPPWSVDGVRAAESAGLSINQTMDVATIAVRRGTPQGAQMAVALYHGLTMITRANGRRWVIMVMDVRARRLLTMMKLQTSALPGTRPGPYLGSEFSLTVWAEVSRMMSVQQENNPAGFELVSEGIGFTDIEIPARGGFRLRSRR